MHGNIHTLRPGYVLRSPEYAYRIERALGQGGFGITYLAAAALKVGNVSVKVNFAIKEHFLGSDCEREPDTSRVVYSNPAKDRVESSRRDFVSEANRLRKVGTGHDNIVKVNEVFEANNTAYYVMEYLEGETLRRYVKSRGRLSEDEMLAIMRPVADAVEYLHRHRMTHLDIKPDNIMIARDETGRTRPVLIDFGLSKHYDEQGNPTSTIHTLGCSDGYAPIEQYAGVTKFSPGTDIYALGATMWFCLTGRDPKKSTELLGESLSESLPDGISDAVKSMIANATRAKSRDRSISLDIKEQTTPDESGVSTELIEAEAVGEAVAVSPEPAEEPDSSAILTSVTETEDNEYMPEPDNGGWLRKYPWILVVGLGLVVLMIIYALPHSSQNDAPEEGLTQTETVLAQAKEAYNTGLYDRALELFREISDDKEAQNYMGYMYREGRGVKQDYAEAAGWYRKSAEQGYAYAQFNLGYMYEQGLGVNQDYAEAAGWYRKSAEQGDADAQYNLGEMYCDGRGVKKDYAEAAKWYRKSAEQGDADAQNNLGKMYYDGLGVKKDYAEAVKWYRKSAEQGNAVAQYNLGFMYYHGRGVKQSGEKAIEWWNKAAAQGDKNAINALAKHS